MEITLKTNKHLLNVFQMSVVKDDDEMDKWRR